MIIYLITNKLNGKQYVGQTIGSLERRISKHKITGHAMYNAIKKYGIKSFDIKEIDKVETMDELNKKEIYWIKKLNTMYPNGYNLVSGGHNAIPCLETRKKQSLSHIGYVAPESQRKHMSESQKIVQLRPSVVEGKRKRMMGNKFTLGVEPWNKGIKGKESHSYGRKQSDEAKEKIRIFHIGSHQTEESKKLISEHNWMKTIKPEQHPMFGKHHTAEALKKMSDATKNRLKPARAIEVEVEGMKFGTKKEAYNYLGWSYGKFQRHYGGLI